MITALHARHVCNKQEKKYTFLFGELSQVHNTAGSSAVEDSFFLFSLGMENEEEKHQEDALSDDSDEPRWEIAEPKCSRFTCKNPPSDCFLCLRCEHRSYCSIECRDADADVHKKNGCYTNADRARFDMALSLAAMARSDETFNKLKELEEEAFAIAGIDKQELDEQLKRAQQEAPQGFSVGISIPLAMLPSKTKQL